MTSVKWNCFNQIDMGDWKRRISDRSLMDSAAQECGDVARTPRHRHDLDGSASSGIDNEVRSTGQKSAHTRGFRHSPDLRCKRARTSAGFTVSPRSKEAKRQASSPLNS